jgi:hypothetical protein
MTNRQIYDAGDVGVNDLVSLVSEIKNTLSLIKKNKNAQITAEEHLETLMAFADLITATLRNNFGGRTTVEEDASITSFEREYENILEFYHAPAPKNRAKKKKHNKKKIQK